MHAFLAESDCAVLFPTTTRTYTAGMHSCTTGTAGPPRFRRCLKNEIAIGRLFCAKSAPIDAISAFKCRYVVEIGSFNLTASVGFDSAGGARGLSSRHGPRNVVLLFF